MDRPQDQETEEEGSEEGQLREKQAAAEGRRSPSNLPEGWREGSDEPQLPKGWRVKPRHPGADAQSPPAAGRRGPLRRRVRRGGGGAGPATTSLTILTQNICGWNCKKASFQTIVDKLNPDICAWQETGLTGNNEIKVKGYHSSLRNRKKP